MSIDKIEQLRALALVTEWFGKGSKIIVTTQDKSILRAHGFHDIYEVGFPSSDEAQEIFSQSAFTQKVPPQGYEELATGVLKLTGHLPLLGLSVLGNSLSGKSVSKDSLIWDSMSEWTAQILARLRSSLNGDIKQVLIVAYNGLSEKDKAIFLHIACLLESISIDNLMQRLRNSGLEIKLGLDVLAERALISIMSDRSIRMHNLLRQMGREIVRGHYIRLPRRCWFFIGANNICVVVSDSTGTAGTAVGILFATLQACHASEESLSRRLQRNLMDMGSKLGTLFNGNRGLAFMSLSLLFFTIIVLLNLKYAFLCIMSMSPSALANFRLGFTRRAPSY